MWQVWGRDDAGFWCGNLKERDHLKDLGVDSIKIDPIDTGWEGVDWTYVAQDRNKCQALLNAVMNLRAPLNARNLTG